MTARIRTLIVDDERLAREELRRLLCDHANIEVCGEAANIEQAAEKISTLDPDVVFLDIKMPGGSGFDLLARLMPPHPRVVFTTAFDAFAIRAFEVNALDYLMKPIAPVRLTAAIERLRASLGPAAAHSPAAAVSATPSIFLQDGEQCWFVTFDRIRLIESEGNYCRIHFDLHRPLLLRSLSALEPRFTGAGFLRANRSQMINLAWIQAVTPWFGNTLRVTLRDGTAVELSRRASQAFREKFRP